jgi:hypothetical protein
MKTKKPLHLQELFVENYISIIACQKITKMDFQQFISPNPIGTLLKISAPFRAGAITDFQH